MNEVPTVKSELLTLVDIFADPVNSSATEGAVLLIPILLFVASTNKTPESKLALPDMV